MDYQLVNCGGGLLDIYTLGQKTGSYHIGEVAMKNIQAMIELLSDDRALQLVQSYCDSTERLRAEQIKARYQRI